MPGLRKSLGMRERSPGRWELIVEGPRDPVTGKRRQVSRIFHGSLREAKSARAELLVEVKRGRHTGTSGTVDDLFGEWIVELRRKGRAKMLTDLYGAHQDRGMKPSTVRKIHATVSSMMTQACRWGWIGINPAQWAEPPPLSSDAPIVPTPEELDRLIKAASTSRRPEYARLLFLASTTGMRRGELLALRRGDIDHDRRIVTVSRSLTDLSHEGVTEGPTKNRRTRRVALDDRTLQVVSDQLAMMEIRTAGLTVELVADCFLFSDALDGSEPWRPMMVTRYFGRLRSRLGLDHLSLKSLRRFMDTYGQDLGFAPAQVALRAGHDPAVVGRFYTGNVAEADRLLAEAVSGLLSTPETPG